MNKKIEKYLIKLKETICFLRIPKKAGGIGMGIVDEINNLMILWEIRNFRKGWVPRYMARLEKHLEKVELPPEEQLEEDCQRMLEKLLHMCYT